MLPGMTTASSERFGCRGLMQFLDQHGRTLLFPYWILSMAQVGCLDLGNAIVPNVVNPNLAVECLLTGTHCGTFHTAFDAPSHLPPFSSFCTPCHLERMLGQMGFCSGLFL